MNMLTEKQSRSLEDIAFAKLLDSFENKPNESGDGRFAYLDAQIATRAAIIVLREYERMKEEAKVDNPF